MPIISFSNILYKKYIVTQIICVSTHSFSCALENYNYTHVLLVQLLVKIYNDWVNFLSHIELFFVSTFCTKNRLNSIVILSTGEDFSNLIALFITSCNGKAQKKYLQNSKIEPDLMKRFTVFMMVMNL